MPGALFGGAVEMIEGDQVLDLNRSIYLRYLSAEGLAHPVEAEALADGDITLAVQMEEVITWDLTGLAFARVLRAIGQCSLYDMCDGA